MNILFAIGQVIALAGLAYGAFLCITWRAEEGPEKAPSRSPLHELGSRAPNVHSQYVAAAETDPAS